MGERADARVLVVDDDDHVRRAITWAVKAWGAKTVDVAASDPAARELLKTQPPYTAMVFDVNLGPGPSGLDLLRWVRGEGIRTRTLVLTAEEAFHLSNAALNLGA